MNQLARGTAPHLNQAQIGSILDAERVFHRTRGVFVLPLQSDAGKLNRSLVELGLARWSGVGPVLTRAGEGLREKLAGGNGR